MTTPAAAPAPSAAATAAGVPVPPAATSAQLTLPTASREPTDRSMPRVRMTNSMPTAMMPVGATWRSTFMTLRSVRKALDCEAAPSTSTRKIAAVP